MVLFRVAVSTSVPETNATPRMIDRAVSASRNLRASRPLTVTFHMSAPQLLHLVEHGVGRRRDQIPDQPPVGQENHAIGICR